MFPVYRILQCPLCKTDINEDLECSRCGEEYVLMNDVYILLNQRLSGKEWKWDKSLFSDDKMEKMIKEYRSYFNEETRIAQEIWWSEMNKHINSFQGIVGDIATGLGSMFQKLLKTETKFIPIATDVDPNALAWTSKKMKEKSEREFVSVATDAKHFAFKDNTFDYLTSLAGLNNIPDTTALLAELYRVLQNGGKLVTMHSFVEEQSKSYNLVKEFNMGRAFVKSFLIDDLNQVGFKKVKANITSSAFWAENPMDGLPIAGDLQYFAIIEAEK